MPDDRLLHRCQGHSAKLAQLDHLAYRVWTQYLLSADDFGVMPSAAALIRGDNFALMREAESEIAAALQTLERVGLVRSFDHQGAQYLCSTRWQEYQRIRWPRKTFYPMPPAGVLREFCGETRKLFDKHPEKLKTRGGGKVAVSHRLTANGCTSSSISLGEGDQGEGAAALTPASLGALWNEAVADTVLAKAVGMSGARRKAAAARLSEHPEPEWWSAYFQRILASDFLMGRVPRSENHAHWYPTFDWVLNPTNLAKIESGNFDNKQGPEVFAAAELARADEVLRKSFGGRCPHGDPACETRDECKREIVRGWRVKGAA